MATAKTATARTAKDATAAFEQATAASSEAVRENVERAMAAAAEMSSIGKENFEAWVASSTAATKGLEALSARAVAYSKSAMEAHMAAAKSLMTAKSVQEVVEKQTQYARTAFDGYVAELTTMSDLMAGLTKDAIKPLNERAQAMTDLMNVRAR